MRARIDRGTRGTARGRFPGPLLPPSAMMPPGEGDRMRDDMSDIRRGLVHLRWMVAVNLALTLAIVVFY
jgi:hypothetical protein